MTAPVVALSGAMAAAAFMTAPQVNHAPAKTSPHTITAHLDAVVQPAAATYTVQAGDTLYGIAQRYYGDGSYWSGLYQANQSEISNPDLISVGQVLAIPSSNEVATVPDPSMGTTTAAISQGSTSTQSSSGGAVRPCSQTSPTATTCWRSAST